MNFLKPDSAFHAFPFTKTLPLPFTILCLLFQLLLNQTHGKPTEKHHRITSYRIWKPTIHTNRHLLPQNRLLPQNTHHEHYKSNTNLNILTFELFFWHSHATISFPQNPKLRSFKYYPHKKTHREKWKLIPDSCYHLHLLHLLHQDSFFCFFCSSSFLFALFLFPFVLLSSQPYFVLCAFAWPSLWSFQIQVYMPLPRPSSVTLCTCIIYFIIYIILYLVLIVYFIIYIILY